VIIIKEGGCRGYVPFESLSVEGHPYDSRARVTQLLAELRETLKQAE
jgi:hypothetical protein